MPASSFAINACPVHPDRAPQDDRRSAAVAQAAGRAAGEHVLRDFVAARALLRDPTARQAGFLADLVGRLSVVRPPILHLHGAAHRRQRGATARFFAPKVVTSTYRDLMEETAAGLVAGFRAKGSAELDEIALTMAVTIAAEIVGLTDSDRVGMARRLDRLVSGMTGRQTPLGMMTDFMRGQARALLFLWRDVKPAIRARRAARRADVISHLLDEGYGDADILTECLTYGAAGMVTTREFITMAAWHLLDRDALRARFLDGDEAQRIAILEEILRLEPVVGMLFRRVAADDDATPVAGAGAAPAPAPSPAPSPIVAIDIRGANGDATAVGACPHRLDPDRAIPARTGGAGLAFGDGEHRCPGAQVALQESAILLDRLLRVPGLRLARVPDIGWNALVGGYELRGATIVCDVA